MQDFLSMNYEGRGELGAWLGESVILHPGLATRRCEYHVVTELMENGRVVSPQG